MYVRGISTRVKAITEKLCRIEILTMQVSQAGVQLDKVPQE